MGYDLHITRKEQWSNQEGEIISEQEWFKIVEEDPEFRLDPDNGPHYALWNGPSEYPDPWLNWFEGDISTKNPDSCLIDKMVEIAKRLDAKVQGDDGEIYIGGGRTLLAPGESPYVKKSSWWRRLLYGH